MGEKQSAQKGKKFMTFFLIWNFVPLKVNLQRNEFLDVVFVCKDGRVEFNKVVLSMVTTFEATFLSAQDYDDAPLQILTPDFDARTIQVKKDSCTSKA